MLCGECRWSFRLQKTVAWLWLSLTNIWQKQVMSFFSKQIDVVNIQNVYYLLHLNDLYFLCFKLIPLDMIYIFIRDYFVDVIYMQVSSDFFTISLNFLYSIRADKWISSWCMYDKLVVSLPTAMSKVTNRESSEWFFNFRKTKTV